MCGGSPTFAIRMVEVQIIFLETDLTDIWPKTLIFLYAGAFLVPYALLTVLCGMPMFLLETSIGQYTQEGFITCWRKMCPIAQGKGAFTGELLEKWKR